MRLTTTDGISIHIRRQGAGPEPILFVHGSFASSRWWMPATALLPPAAFTTYLVDLRGCGDSDRPADPAGYSVERQAHDIPAPRPARIAVNPGMHRGWTR